MTSVIGFKLSHFAVLGFLIGVLAAIVPVPLAAQALKKVPQETLDIGDEPGRVSTEEAVISDGPFARQVVFFRSNEPPGTLVELPPENRTVTEATI